VALIATNSRPIAPVIRPLAIVLAALGAVMLIAMIFYPFGYDQAVFALGGEMVRKGAVPVRDFLDTKPPLIFYIYSVASGLFGDHEWSIRLVDILFWIGASFYFYKILRRYLASEISIIAVSLTVILYAGSGFWMTAEAESFALLPSLILLDVTLRAVERPTRAFLYSLIMGVAAFALLMLKFTLVLGPLAAILFIFLDRRISARTKWSVALGLIASLAALGLIFLWSLRISNSSSSFLEWLHWLSYYSSVGRTERSLLEEIFLRFPGRLIYSASPTLLLFGALGVALFIRHKKNQPLFTLLLLTFCFQLLGVLIERKIEFPYQYTRALWALTPFAAIAIQSLLERLNANWNSTTVLARAAIVLCLIALVIGSPLSRIATQSIPWTVAAIRGNQPAEVQHRIPDYFAKEQHDVASYLTARMQPRDQLFFWGNDVAIYFFAGRLPQTICLTATPLRTAGTPISWKSKLLSQLNSTPPKYFVAEFGDAKPYITGSDLDSYSALLAWPEMREYLVTHYTADTTIGHFFIFRKTS